MLEHNPFKGPVTVMCIKNLDFPKVSRINVNATEPNSDAGGAVNVRGYF